jgi:hypothetical protein
VIDAHQRRAKTAFRLRKFSLWQSGTRIGTARRHSGKERAQAAIKASDEPV